MGLNDGMSICGGGCPAPVRPLLARLIAAVAVVGACSCNIEPDCAPKYYEYYGSYVPTSQPNVADAAGLKVLQIEIGPRIQTGVDGPGPATVVYEHEGKIYREEFVYWE